MNILNLSRKQFDALGSELTIDIEVVTSNRLFK